MHLLFRAVAILEGVSYLLLIFIAVPIKYFWKNEEYVQLLGMPHGLLFVAYLALIYFLKNTKNWNSKDISVMVAASIIPFGTFYVEWKYLK